MPKISERDFDAVIVGGGPAGSVAGAFLARAGLRTLIVEKEKFPRFHIGESLLPAGNAILREIGAWEKVEAAGFMKKTGAEFHVGNRLNLFKRVRFRDGMIGGSDYTYQVERARFDELLFRHAAGLGCETRERTKLTAARELPGGAGWEVTLQSAADGAEPTATTLRAGWLIDASGRDNVFSHPLKADRVDPGGNLPKRAAIYSHFRHVRRQPGEPGGNIIIVRHADGWFWLIPLDAERTSVGLVTTLERIRAAGRRPPAEIFAETVAASPKLSELMAGAEPVTGFHVTSDYTYRARRFASSRLLLVGDAAGFFDPIFSSGVFLALHSAKLATAELLAAEKRGRALSSWQQARYTRRLGRSSGIFQKLILAFYDNASYAVFVDRHPPLRLGNAVNSIVAGHTSLPWRVRWRLRVFLLICRLQRHWPLVPPIELSNPAATAPTPPAELAVG